MTRAAWYAQRHAGTWRTARKPRRCDCRPAGDNNLRCMNVTLAGAQYFDTNAHNPFHASGRATIGLCDACAKQEIEQ